MSPSSSSGGYDAEPVTRLEVRDALNKAIQHAESRADTDDRITSEISLAVSVALEMVRDELYDRWYR